MWRRIAELWRSASPLVRAEITASAWESFSALLYAAAIIAAAFDSPYPRLLFLAGLAASAIAGRFLAPRRRAGHTAAAALRAVLWLGAFAPLLGITDARVLVATMGFGLMGGVIRSAVYRRMFQPPAG